MKGGFAIKRWHWLGIALLVLAAGLVFAERFWISQQERKAEHPEPVGEAAHGEEGILLSGEAKRNIGLQTERVDRRRVQRVITVSGIVKPKPDRVARVSSRIEGIVEQAYVSPFEWVKAGQKLADVRSRQFGNPPPLVPLTAPISGLITRWEANRGEPVDPSKVVFEIVDPSRIWVEGDIPEDEARLVRTGQEVRINVVALPEETFTGRVVRMSGMVEPEKRTIHVWAEVPNPRFLLKPEMFAELAVAVGDSDRVLAVPLRAILKTGGETFAYVESEERYFRRNVVVGLSDDRYVEIKEGLSEGDRVVTRGNYELMSSIFIKGGAEEHTH